MYNHSYTMYKYVYIYVCMYVRVCMYICMYTMCVCYTYEHSLIIKLSVII